MKIEQFLHSLFQEHFLSFPFFIYYINNMYKSLLSHNMYKSLLSHLCYNMFFYINSRTIKPEFALYSLEDFPVEGEYFFSHKRRISCLLYQSIYIYTHTHLFLFRARIHLLLQFLTRLNSNFLLIVTHDRTKRSGTFAGVLLQTNIFLLTYPACRSNLPRAET